MAKIKAICFDLDGVYFTPQGKKSFQEALIREYGITKDFAEAFMSRSPEMAKLVRGQITNENFWNRFRELTGLTKTDQELADRWVRDYEVDTNVQHAVVRARELGYKTCVCSNNNGIRLPVLIEKFDLDSYFDVITSSHEVGFCKPDKEIFRALLNSLQVKPEELVYSDDNPNRLQGARELGIQAFVYENFDQFLRELADLGINLQ